MNSRDLISLAFRNLLRRKTRTILAVIGVVVGTSAIIVMLSIGFGLSVSFQEQIEQYGNLHLVDVYGSGGGGMMYYSPGMRGGSSGATDGVLDDRAISAMEKIEGVDAVSPKVQFYVSLGIGKYIAQTSLIGIRPEVMQKFNYDLQDGRLLEAGDKFEMVFGNQVPSWFYDPKKTWGSTWGAEAVVDVITSKLIVTADESYGQKQRIRNPDEEKIDYKIYKAKGVGILANPNDESAYNVYMSLEGLEVIKKEAERARKQTSSSNSGYEAAMVYVGDINDVQAVSDAIREMGFQTSSLNDWLKAMQDQARMIQGILGGIGAISLLVAALGITNTMIMSIYERTKEIGIMKVIGANLGDIRRLFLLEAGMIGFLGGLLGLIFSLILSLLMNTVLSGIMSMVLGSIGGGGSTVSIIPWWVAAGSLVFSTTIGIIAGYSPARRAMRLSALESLRNE
ncbi:MAG TPA: FtsX-like permease family protein [Anaerovoracaceae bacterium]|nr:FtsX-like permease family protein [Anaerovoracaceae bacterium]